MDDFINILFVLATLVGYWMIFRKMGREGWEGVIPGYNLYVLCEELYGDGWKCLFVLIPFYNIYFIIKLDIDLAHAFNQSTGFGVGLAFLSFIFCCILGFGPAVYGDGSKARTDEDFVTRLASNVSSAADRVGDNVRAATAPSPSASDQLTELASMRDSGLITEEEFQAKKAEILSRF